MTNNDNYYYTKEHEWIKIEGDKAYIGITDYAQKSIGNIVYVDLPDVDDNFVANESFAVIESIKSASDVYMPVNGKIVEINEELEDSPYLINKNANDVWIIAIKEFNSQMLNELMDYDKYEKYCKEIDEEEH